MARRPGFALGMSVLVAGVTLLAAREYFGKPLGWEALLILFVGGTVSGMGIAKAKREWHDAWVRETFRDVVIRTPHEDADPRPTPVIAESGDDENPNRSGHDHLLRLPHDGPDSDLILSLPHETEGSVSGRSEQALAG